MPHPFQSPITVKSGKINEISQPINCFNGFLSAHTVAEQLFDFIYRIMTWKIAIGPLKETNERKKNDMGRGNARSHIFLAPNHICI